MNEDFMAKFNHLIQDVGEIKTLCSQMKLNLDDITQQVQTLKAETGNNTTEIQALKVENQDLKTKLNELELYSRKANIIINGIPVLQDEDVKDIIKVVASSLEIEVHDYEICMAHRLPSKGKSQPIIVRFNNYEKRNEMIRKGKLKKLTGADFGLDSQPIYIDEHLNKQTMELIKYAKKMVADETIKFAWCKDGKVLIRILSDSPAILIKELEQLYQVEKETKSENVARKEEPAKPDKKRTVGNRSPDSNEPDAAQTKTPRIQLKRSTNINANKTSQGTLDHFRFQNVRNKN